MSTISNDTYYMSTSEISAAINLYDSYLLNASVQTDDVMSALSDFSDHSISTLIGDTWDDNRENIQNYSDYLEVSQAINSEIITTNKECLQMIKNFLGTDTELDTSRLHEFEVERDSLTAEIE